MTIPYEIKTFLTVLLDAYLVIIFIDVILSYVAPLSNNSAVKLIRKLSNFTLNPIRELTQNLSLGTLDISPLVVYFIIRGIKVYILPYI